MIIIRDFTVSDAAETAQLIAITLRISNAADYSEETIQKIIDSHRGEDLIQQAKGGHFFVACDGDTIVGCGGIVGYWGSLTESFIMTVFVLPEYQKQGIGKRIIEAIEADEIFLRAWRTEIAASITAFHFYRKLGYSYKNGISEPDEFGYIRLEKFNESK